jgi:alginate O-acetyltransferase complex protein AlgI
MRPFRSSLLLLILMAVLTGMHFLLPVNNLFPSPGEFIPVLNTGHQVSRPEVVQDHAVPPVSDTAAADTTMSVRPDSAASACLKPEPLAPFFDSLRYSTGQVRIIYYGDSQIEGDRITSYLRQSLRQIHGGTGPGLFLPLMPVMYTKTIWIKSSSNWKKYNYLSYASGRISHRKLGPFMAVCRFIPEGRQLKTEEKAYVIVRKSSVADSAATQFDNLRIFYGNCTGSVKVLVKAGETEIFSDTLTRGSGINETDCALGRPREVTIEFQGRTSPDIYGLSIESKSGVIVDNIPQRGSAGLEFTMVDSSNLSASYKILHPDLFVLQYGLNIVRNVRSEYSYFEKGLGRQINLLKAVSPSTPILVLGITDMAQIDLDSIRSFRNIPSIIEAQKKAAIDADETFWDAYRSMGGESSIIKWARRDPPLAQKDYVHFTYPGADTLSNLLVKSLFEETSVPVKVKEKLASVPDTVSKTAYASPPPAPSETVNRSTLGVVISDLLRFDPGKPLIFTTAAFWLFFLVVLMGYSIIYKRPFLRNAYLFLVSLYFYYKSGGLFLILLIIVTVVDFTCGLLIYNAEKKAARRSFILISILSNIGLLAYFKYAGFFVNIINNLFGTGIQVHDYLAEFSNYFMGTSFSISSIVLPVGISFFTFQSLSYTIDVYRRKMTPVRSIVDFGFYVSFFPQLVAGPIVRASEFIPQLYTNFNISKREFSHALFLVSKGLIKKIIISDFIAVNFIDRVFDAPSLYSGFENLMAVYGYGLQIYCDFSGYTDIAIGLGLILGFRFPINFNSPYKALDISDFWKRWHISLSRWLKDYLYIPLGGNRKGRVRTYINLFVTMLLGGLWHGAALRFLVWGFLHGIGLIFTKLWHALFRERMKRFMAGRALSFLLTFNFVSFCWIFFRAPDMDSVKIMLRQITENFSPGSYMTVLPAYSSTFLLIAVGYIIHLLPESIKEAYRGLFIRTPVAVQMVLMLVVGMLLFHMRSAEIMPFIYFRF